MMDQKESENISDNLRWSIDMRCARGNIMPALPRLDTNLWAGKLELILEQALIIRHIYDTTWQVRRRRTRADAESVLR